MNWLEALILGIIQGLTEFLPVSSSGHIELGKAILNVHVKDPLLFSIVVHGATALSTIVVFWKVILELIKGVFQFKWNEETKFVGKIVLSMIPVGVVGVLFEDQIEAFFDGQILLVGLMLWLTGGLLFLTLKAKEKTGEVNFVNAFIIGIAQTIAILPGISRSGATISTALLLGVNKGNAAKFSFLMVLPPIMGALLIKCKKYFDATTELIALEANTQNLEEISSTVLIIGFIAAFISGLAACKWMIHIVKNGKLNYFTIYCFIVGTIAIISTFI